MTRVEQAESLVKKYPRLYHMAEAGSWPSIQQHGLLSVAALLDFYEVQEPRRTELLSEWRKDSVPIIDGAPVIRDQHPMPPHRLEKVLQEGLTPYDWYEFLNRKCFFWVDECRLSKMMGFYKGESHDVIVVDTKKLVERHLERITVSHINSGTVRNGKHRRGKDTFQSIDSFPLFGPRKKEVAELTVEGGVPDIEDFVMQVTRRKGPIIQQILWPK